MKPKSTDAPAFRPGRHLQILDNTVHDPYLDTQKLAEPSVCPDCGAVYHKGRWQWGEAPAHSEPARCPACRRIKEKLPAGYVSIQGSFARENKEEVLALARNIESREKAEHPLKRIIGIESEDDGLLLTTTDIHLARSIGEALESAYKGELDFHYNEEEYLLRVRWRR